MQRILIINGHPDSESYCSALANAYKKGVLDNGAELKEIRIADLQFNPNLKSGYRQRSALEPDLLASWDKIEWADHLVWVYPVWWASFPAILKGFIDRLFLPGFAFQRRENSLLSDGLLTGKTARIISTLDQPAWYYHLINRRPSYWALKRNVLRFCGVRIIKTTTIGPIHLSSASWRKKWLSKVEKLGSQLK